MTTKLSNERIAKQTVEYLDAGYYESVPGRKISLPVDRGIQTSELYKPGTSFSNPTPEDGPTTRIEVTQESTLDASNRLKVCYPFVLNFASAKNPGGGFLTGANAQEESLARSTTLYKILLAHPEYYVANRQCKDLLYTDHAIWAPNVSVFRDNVGLPLPTPYKVALLTLPAPNAGQYLSRYGADPKALDACIERRIDLLLGVAAHHGHTDLVLGAWGCGVFGNDAKVMAHAFKAALQRWHFERVVFGIYGGGETYETFKDVLTP